MPLNPEASERAQLIFRLRSHAAVSFGRHALDLRAAANLIESIGPDADRMRAVDVLRARSPLANKGWHFIKQAHQDEMEADDGA